MAEAVLPALPISGNAIDGTSAPMGQLGESVAITAQQPNCKLFNQGIFG